MKKKNKMLMIVVIVAALSIFAVTAVASTPSLAGYDAFKELLKANHMSEGIIQSATANGSFTVTVDGEMVLEANGTVKAANAGNVSSDFDFTIMGVERSGSVFSSDENNVYVVDQTHGLHYQVINLDEGHNSKHNEWMDKDDFHNRPINRAEEALLDFIVGDLKSNFSVTNHTDGSKTIMLDVSKEEIPLPLRLLVDVASTDETNKRAHAEKVPAEWERLKQLPFFQGFDGVDLAEQLPELTKDVVIEHVQLQLTVDANNVLQGVQSELEMSGKDVAGVTHHVKIEGAGNISGINVTTPGVYNHDNKSIEIIDAATFSDHK